MFLGKKWSDMKTEQIEIWCKIIPNIFLEK